MNSEASLEAVGKLALSAPGSCEFQSDSVLIAH